MITKLLTGSLAAGVVGLFGAAAAQADPDDPIDWKDGNTVPTYDIGNSLSQGANGSYYDGASFTNGATTLTGDQILIHNGSGGYDNVFAVYDPANIPPSTSPYPPLNPFEAYDIYNVNQWGSGFTNVYSDVAGHVTDIVKTPIGNFDISWLGWLLAPNLESLTAAGMPSTPVTDPTDFFNDASGAGLYSAFNAADGTLVPTDFFSDLGF